MYSNPAGKCRQTKMLLKHRNDRNDRKSLRKTANSFHIAQGLYKFSALWLCSTETKSHL